MLQKMLQFGFNNVFVSSHQLSIGVTIHHLNIVSLNKNLDKIENFLNEFKNKLEIIFVSETRVNDSIPECIDFPGYSFLYANFKTKAKFFYVFSINCHKLPNMYMALTGCKDLGAEAIF